MESYGTIWVCVCCMLSHANGECCADDQHGGDGVEPLSSISDGFHVAMGMARENHDDSCDAKCKCTQDDECEEHDESEAHHDPSTHVTPDDYECDCEKNTYSTSQCEGCGSYLHGERHAMTLFKG